METPAGHTARVVGEVASERARQREGEQWTLDHDDQHSVNDWAALMTRYVGLALDAAERNEPEVYRHRVIQVAAVAVAAVESLDRVLEAARAINSMAHVGDTAL